MCGISGIISTENRSIDSSDIESMNRLIEHRGPDDQGCYFGYNFALGHRRLSIIGLGHEGHQPMSFKSRSVISFNGEIYNYIEIKEELVSLGYEFQTSTDTEVILAAYDCWGHDCVNHFNGMWAFVLFDIEKNVLFCSRDRFGIKPFYYAKAQQRFVFGSEIKQLLPFLQKTIANRKILLDYLLSGLEEHSDDTFFQDIKKLPAGSNLVYNLATHEYTINKYYSISITKHSTDSVQKYYQDFQQAVALRMRSDVSVGMCLSGGLDSSSIAAFSSKLANDHRLNAIHAQSSEHELDESIFAKSVAEHCNLLLHTLTPSCDDFINAIDDVIYTQEEPFGSPSIIMQYFVMKKAKEINCKVMLDGQGGDETLLGYERYYPAYLMCLPWRKKISGLINSSRNSKLSLTMLIKYIIYFTRYDLRMKRIKSKYSFIKKEILNSYESDILKILSRSYLNIEQLQKLEITSTQLPHLLKYEDKNSMRHSIEARLPFIDYHVLETALSADNNLKINKGWTKYLLRKAVDSLLPKNIVWRKHKLGFNAPERTWLEELEPQFMPQIKKSLILKQLVDMNKLDMSKVDLRMKWRLFNIAKWEDLYDVKNS